MSSSNRTNILLVDDQPAKLLSYEVMLEELGANLIKTVSGREALEQLLKNDIAVILIDVCMPDQDGFELAATIRQHPRYQKTAIIFVSAIHLAHVDHLRGYEMGAVDYVPVPVIPEVLRAKVKVFIELYRKTRQLEELNAELERRVAERTADLEASTAQLLESEQRRNMALSAGNMGSWDWDVAHGSCVWDEGQCRIFGVDPAEFEVTATNTRALVQTEDWERLQAAMSQISCGQASYRTEFRAVRPDGELRWCIGTAAASFDGNGKLARLSGVTVDITERKRIEEHHALLAREVDHRAKNSLAVVQSIIRLTKANTIKSYVSAVEGRVQALSQVHSLLAQTRWQGADLATLVEEELAPYGAGDPRKIAAAGTKISVSAPAAQTLALALHELATNAAKYGALSCAGGRVKLSWETAQGALTMQWKETGGPAAQEPARYGLGLQVIGASVKSQLGGRATFDWRGEGLICTLSIPCAEARCPPQSLAKRAANGGGEANPANEISPRTRILLVEDEALVSMMVGNLLDELGYCVVGPCATTLDAVAAASECEFDAAILDINLGGELVYPVAELLRGRNVPFVFMTGYGRETIDSRFAHVTILEKPLELDRLRDALQGLRETATRLAEPADLRA